MALPKWVDEVAVRLGVDVDVDVSALLELAGEVERDIDRPAAPLTTFLIGYAAARAGGDASAVREATAAVRAFLTEGQR